MTCLRYDAHDESATAALGAALARVLPDGTTVALCGTLGAGKTRLVQAIAAAVGIDRSAVISPTFVLARQYGGLRQIHHLDAYRIRDDDEFIELGVEEVFDSDALVLVEWADRVERCLPGDRVEVNIEVTGPESRRFELIGSGPRSAEAIGRLAAELGQETV